MKVVLYHTSIETLGGAERLLFEEFLFLKRKGLEVKLLTFDLKNEEQFRDYLAKIRGVEVLKAYGNSIPRRAIALRKRLSELRPELVISASGSVELYLATRFTSIPYVLHIHGTMFWFHNDLVKYGLVHRRVFEKVRDSVAGHREFIPSRPTCSLAERFELQTAALLDYLAVRNAREIIVLTPQVQWEIQELYKKRAVIANGCLDRAIFDYIPKKNILMKLGLNDAKIILSVSRLDPRKRISVLLESFMKLSKTVDNAVLVIVGTGPDEKRLKSLAKQLNCSNKIIFTGFVNNDQLWDYYDACDVFACPGWTTSPITAYEALAFNKKVVWTSEASEPDEILNSPLVFIADPNPNSFADALQKALSANIKTNVDLSKYTWDNYFETVYKVIQRHVKDA